MSLIKANGAGEVSTGFYNNVATQSLRFDDGSSAYLTFTPSSASSATDRRKVTHSVWVKRGVLGADQTIYSGNRASGGDYYLLRFSSDNKLTLILDVDAGGYGYDTSAVYRDVGAWYHVCVIIDTTQSTDTNRVKIYVNGVLQDKSTKYAGGHVPQNFSTYVMDGNEDEVGRFAFTDASYFDGYMAEFITTIGQDNTISEFGELKNGVWIPIDYAGSYGGNGFRLQFNQTGTGTASSSTIGADTSGNANHFTSSGIVASDCNMPDSPELNWCTLNPLFATGVTNTFSEGNLKVATSSSGRPSIASSFVMPTGTGKWFFEARVSGNGGGIGIMRTDAPYNNDFYYGDYQWSVYGHSVIHNGASVGSLTGSATYPEVYGLMLDTDTDTLKVYVGGSEVGSFSVDAGYDYYPISGDGSGAVSITSQFNFGQDSTFQGDETAGGNADANGIGDFSMTVPTGALALCTSNLPEPTISPNADTQAENYFGVLTWSGDDNASRTIATGGSGVSGSVDFTPDWAWIKRRNGSSNGSDHLLLDIVRGVGSFNGLTSNGSSIEGQTAAGSTWSNFGDISAFATNGFTVQKGSDPSHTLEGINQSGGTYVGWNWKAGGTGASNTNGTINSSVSANTDAGFSIATWSGNSTSGATIGHGLSSAPNLIITKCRSHASSWTVGIGNIAGFSVNDYVSLNSNNGKGSSSTFYQSYTTNSNTTFQVGVSAADEMNKTGRTYVSYCFAEVEGFSLFGKFVGNGLADGTFVFTNFTPAFVLIKDADTAGYNWYLYDNLRKPYNNNSKYLIPNTIGVEIDYVGDSIDHLSNGFKLRTLAGGRGTNRSNINYIYMAFAENPFKYSTGR